MGGFLAFVGLLAFLAGLISLLKPLRLLRIASRKMGGVVGFGGLLLLFTGGGIAGTSQQAAAPEATTTTVSTLTSTTASSSTTTAAPTSTTTPPPTTLLSQEDETSVERVIDGDTIVVAGGERVRLIGIDTPEVDQDACYAAEAAEFITSLIPPGEELRLVYDVERYDRFGRTLAYVYRSSDELFVNAEMMAQGYAVLLTIPPNVEHAEEFLELQGEARDANRGLWAACATTTTTTSTSTTTTTLATTTTGQSCHPSYEGACVPIASDVDCAGGSGNGPAYVRGPVRVVGPDVYDLDRDGDGIGCES